MLHSDTQLMSIVTSFQYLQKLRIFLFMNFLTIFSLFHVQCKRYGQYKVFIFSETVHSYAVTECPAAVFMKICIFMVHQTSVTATRVSEHLVPPISFSEQSQKTDNEFWRIRKETVVARFEVLILEFAWWKWVKVRNVISHDTGLHVDTCSLSTGYKGGFLPTLYAQNTNLHAKIWCILNRWIYVCVCVCV